ncbi:hypothetical protein M9H77_22396 [Catharanthus roseus]|uniref:Uncharacterized protein n=1 Tax=Catharanthus roseus TaxID=4058 RepID=A0ACC0AQ32_CATRO|nr:hypothetical protein M9H77_22396 [Catharanthus roseus]
MDDFPEDANKGQMVVPKRNRGASPNGSFSPFFARSPPMGNSLLALRAEEHKGKVALFEKKFQDLAWHVVEAQEEDLRGSKTLLDVDRESQEAKVLLIDHSLVQGRRRTSLKASKLFIIYSTSKDHSREQFDGETDKYGRKGTLPLTVLRHLFEHGRCVPSSATNAISLKRIGTTIFMPSKGCKGLKKRRGS